MESMLSSNELAHRYLSTNAQYVGAAMQYLKARASVATGERDTERGRVVNFLSCWLLLSVINLKQIAKDNTITLASESQPVQNDSDNEVKRRN